MVKCFEQIFKSIQMVVLKQKTAIPLKTLEVDYGSFQLLYFLYKRVFHR